MDSPTFSIGRGRNDIDKCILHRCTNLPQILKYPDYLIVGLDIGIFRREENLVTEYIFKNMDVPKEVNSDVALIYQVCSIGINIAICYTL